MDNFPMSEIELRRGFKDKENRLMAKLIQENLRRESEQSIAKFLSESPEAHWTKKELEKIRLTNP